MNQNNRVILVERRVEMTKPTENVLFFPPYLADKIGQFSQFQSFVILIFHPLYLDAKNVTEYVSKL